MFKQGLILVVTLAAFGSGMVHAEKPEGMGQGKGPQREEMREERNAQGKYGDEAKKAQAREEAREMEKAQKKSGNAYQGEGPGQGQKGQAGAGQEKQKARVMEQEQKELGKGSEQGQESREQRRKWWRFWE